MLQRFVVPIAVLLGCVVFAPVSARAAELSADTKPAGANIEAPSEYRIALRHSRELEFNDPSAAYLQAVTALAVARVDHDHAEILAALIQAARTARLIAAYVETDALTTEGAALASRLGDEPARGQVLIVRGMMQWNLARLPAATSSFLEARTIAERFNSDDLRIGAECGLGLVQGRGDEPEQSRLHLETALHLAERTQDPRVSTILNYLGNNYLQAKDYAQARTYFERALPMAREQNNNRVVAYLLLNLGEIATNTGDQALAAQYLDEAMGICRQSELLRGTADGHYLYARVERNRGNNAASAQHLDEGMTLARRLGNPDLFALYYGEYILTRRAQGDFRGALDYADLLAEVTETIRGERSRQKVAEIQASFEAESRNRQIKLLQRDADLQQSALDLSKVELSRASARSYALGEIVVFAAIIGAMFLARQRTRTRRATRQLAEVSAAKYAIEQSDARKGRLLDIATLDLNNSEARFRDAFVHSPLGLALVSLDGRWLRANQALCQILGYTEAELLLTTSQALTHPDDLGAELALLEGLLQGEGETYHLDKRFIHRSGDHVWIRLDVSLHRDPSDGRPRHFISQVQDITERRRADEQLKLTMMEAARANAAKNDFLSRMSHELRTPLNAILGFGQLLELEDLGKSHNQGVGYILTAGRHLLSLINEVLDLSSIESGQFALSMEPTGVSELMSATMEMMRPLAREAGVGMLLDACPCGGTILVDPRRLTQVFLNLMSNAIKYNRRGGHVHLRCSEADGQLRIDVQDTGAGIAGADLERIFAPFARLPESLEIPGTGLGLPLSRALIEAMGGTLEVASEPGVGSTFSVRFASVEAPEELPPIFEPITAPAVARSHPAPSGRRHKLLYVEDDLINLELIQRLLSMDPSLDVLTAMKGGRGLEIARAEKPDLILLDIHLSDMDGADLMETLRSDAQTCDIPVVIVSADAMTERIERMRLLGAAAYVTKPIGIEDLRQTIAEVLAKTPEPAAI